MKLSMASIVVILFAGLGIANAENWPCWRGPRGDGTTIESNLPLEWDAASGKNIAWKASVPYTGHSSPVIWGDRIFLTGADEAKSRRMLMAFDRGNGKLLWEIDVEDAPLEKKHKLNSWASGTPATDGHLIYVTKRKCSSRRTTSPVIKNGK
jgi:outer membrane protein assembly factor BamB